MSETTTPNGVRIREAGMCEVYGIRGRIADIDTVSKRAWLQPIGADYFVEVCFPPDLDPATVFPKYVEVMGTVTKDANGRVVRVLADQCRNMYELGKAGDAATKHEFRGHR